MKNKIENELEIFYKPLKGFFDLRFKTISLMSVISFLADINWIIDQINKIPRIKINLCEMTTLINIVEILARISIVVGAILFVLWIIKKLNKIETDHARWIFFIKEILMANKIEKIHYDEIDMNPLYKNYILKNLGFSDKKIIEANDSANDNNEINKPKRILSLSELSRTDIKGLKLYE